MNESFSFHVAPDYIGEFAKRNEAICKMLTQEPISSGDFTVIQRMNGENRFARCLGYLSVFQNVNVTNLKSWASYIEKAVKAAGVACGRTFDSKYEIRLFSYAVAIRTFPDGEGSIAQLAPFDSDELQGIASLKIDSDERVWAMYIFGNSILDCLSRDPNRDFHVFLRLMVSLAYAKEKYAEVDAKMPHFSNMGVFLNAEEIQE